MKWVCLLAGWFVVLLLRRPSLELPAPSRMWGPPRCQGLEHTVPRGRLRGAGAAKPQEGILLLLNRGYEGGTRLFSDEKQWIEVTAWEIPVKSQKSTVRVVRQRQSFPRGFVIFHTWSIQNLPGQGTEQQGLSWYCLEQMLDHMISRGPFWHKSFYFNGYSDSSVQNIKRAI